MIGLFAVQGYGINIDENTEIDIARMDLKEYVRLFFWREQPALSVYGQFDWKSNGFCGN